ncbi:D-2-hydroxyacid dehydrogenase [Helicobacter cinaedi]|uniref:D-2-hydroxyacid dehydrogenase n=1 Tax=Helicobacter cinaedi TaxID=213 RepID=UPI000CF0E441|nr:D-2-hydroxyacid dehydrogenase [Helicobacter cinaedi]AWK62197.1 D-2-hydroxyacid dehydrogenase [Helicobacter cinaedi]QOQ95256.1 D-2-hydroxyacid dehydrogenase [Helicobacter cinaedi]
MKIVLLDANTLGDCDLSRFKALGEFVSYGVTLPHQRIERCAGADVVLTNKVMLDESVLSQLPDLKLICITATGMNNVDLDFAKKKGIVVKNVADYSTTAVAQHTLSIALHLLARLGYYDAYCKSGAWCESDTFTHINGGLRELENLQWGIIGFGSIGQRVGNLAQAFGAKVSYYSTSGKNTQSGFMRKELDEILSQSDIISIHAPLNPQTHNLINYKNLSLIKDRAILINVGRGGIVNENDIAEFLKNKDMYFGTDVLEIEPMKPNHPFLDKKIADKILITPHLAWAYDKARERLLELTLENIKNF